MAQTKASSAKSLARAFTTRRAKEIAESAARENPRNRMTRSVSSLRDQISGPISLLHTTNMLSYTAPDLHPKSASSLPAQLTRSDDDCTDCSPTASTPPTSPDTSVRSGTNSLHASKFYDLSSLGISTPSTPNLGPTANLVHSQPAPSSQWRASDARHPAPQRHRSYSNISESSSRTVATVESTTFSRSPSISTSVSTTSLGANAPVASSPRPPKPKVPPAGSTVSSPLSRTSSGRQMRSGHSLAPYPHPFGHELAQVSELAEEFGVNDIVILMEQEERELIAAGFFKFTAHEYQADVLKISKLMFPTQPPPKPSPALWI